MRSPDYPWQVPWGPVPAEEPQGMRSAADALADGLARLGATDVWALGAAKIDDALGGVRRHPELRVRGVSTEQDAVFAADGCARVTGLGVAAFIGSVGLTWAAVGVQTVVLEQQPVLLLIGQTDLNEVRGKIQDTRLSDAAVLRALGCDAWHVHRPQDLPAAWDAAISCLRMSRPAALLIDESALRGPWLGELEADGVLEVDGVLAVNEGPAVDNGPAFENGRAVNGWTEVSAHPSLTVTRVPAAMTRASIWHALEAADPLVPKFADAGQVRQAVGVLDGSERIHQCPLSACLGWALPAAMGAASRGRTYAVCGDGAFMMSLPALASIGHLNLPVTVVVAANGILGVDAARVEPVPDDLVVPAIDIVEVSRAMRVPATIVESPADIVAMCASQGGPQLLVAPVPAFEEVPQWLP